MRHRNGGRVLSQIAWVAFALLPQAAAAIEIRFDYSYDTNGVFATPERRAALDYAAETFEVFTDELAPISYGDGSWTAQFNHPSANSVVILPGLDLAANEVLIFVGAYDLEGTALARGTVGAFTSVLDPVQFDLLQTRGQENAWGSSPTDFGRWGGMITFDTQRLGESTPRNWHFDVAKPPPDGAMDLYSVALHEIAHVLGFSISPNPAKPLSFETHLDRTNNLFTGPNAEAAYGGPVPTDSSGHHWSNSIKSEYNGNPQTPIMVPGIYAGARRGFTTLDYAAMADIGWEVPVDLLAPPVKAIIGDYSGDDQVNIFDYFSWRSEFGSTKQVAADGNFDNRVDAADFVLWRNAFDTSAQIEGDFDYNGRIDARDYAVWNRDFGSTTEPAADANGSGRVDIADYVLWRNALQNIPHLTGDFDYNDRVNASDYNYWRNHFGSSTALAADANGNRRVDAADFVLWRDKLGSTISAASAAQTAVPEPAGWVLALLCLTTFIAIGKAGTTLALWPTAISHRSLGQRPR